MDTDFRDDRSPSETRTYVFPPLSDGCNLPILPAVWWRNGSRCMKRFFTVCMPGVAWGGWLLMVGMAGAEPVSFDRSIRPILSDHCFLCHGPDGSSRKVGLRLDLEEHAKGPLRDASAHALVPGDPGASEAVISRREPQAATAESRYLALLGLEFHHLSNQPGSSGSGLGPRTALHVQSRHQLQQ